MTVFEIKRHIQDKIKPFRFRYELDAHTNQYYFILYNTKLNSCFVGIPKSIMNNEKLIRNKLKILKEKYENL